MTSFSRFRQYVLAGASAVGGALVSWYVFQDDDKRVYASWTTNFTPSERWDSNWDRMSPMSLVKPAKEGEENENKYNEELEKSKSTAVRHILLIRHGQYNLNGSTDKERTLTDLGCQQARLTGQRLRELDLPYSRLVRSTMTRATQTAKIIEQELKCIPVEDCCMLREGAPIPPEPPVGHWRPEFHQFHQDGARIEAAFRRYFHRAPADQKDDSYDILVCHANVIRYFVCRALQFPPEAWLRMSLKHASITWISVLPSGRVTLHAYGDSGHMPPSLISSS